MLPLPAAARKFFPVGRYSYAFFYQRKMSHTFSHLFMLSTGYQGTIAQVTGSVISPIYFPNKATVQENKPIAGSCDLSPPAAVFCHPQNS